VTVLFGLGIWACGRTARDLGGEDPAAIVWDEVVGYLVAMTCAPAGWPWVLAGFVLFRVLDIWKPWPIRWLDRRVHGGLGIMLDDLAAGALAGLILWLASRALG
jgi:phosphatidylglycerophosphatase A